LDTRDDALASGWEQTRFDALMEPSRQRNCSSKHRSIPPFFPEHGRLPECAVAVKNAMNNSRLSRIVISSEVKKYCVDANK
jgi:hypothetical protein